MSLYLEEKYLKLLSHRLEGFKDKGNHLYNCRCPLCKDSEKKKSKKRGYFFQRAGILFYSCHNCGCGSKSGISIRFTTFLKDFDANLYKQMSMELFKEKMVKEVKKEAPDMTAFIPRTKKYVPNIFDGLPLVRDLDSDNVARAFADKRHLPVDSFDFYYAENFIEWTRGNTDKFAAWKGEDHSRLVIPWRDSDGKIIGYTARALDNLQDSKYYRILIDETAKQRVFGLDRLDAAEQAYVLEGEIDSLMIPNAVAVGNGKLNVYVDKKAIYIPDNDVRNPHIMRAVKEMVDQGLRVCMMPEGLPGKDLNELVIAGWTQDDLLKMIAKNTYAGLEAKLHFTTWKKTK